MKNWILLYLLLLGLGTILLPSCADDDIPSPCYCSDEGIILEEDPRDCFCCGGWFIEIGGDTLRALTLPQEFYATLVPGEIPLPVYLEWTPDETPCLGDEIEVACIRRRE